MNTHTATKASAPEWLVPAALIALSIVPVAAGAFRLAQLSSGAITPDNARFFVSPLPVVLHIISVSIYSLLGAFQFAPGFRRRRPGWHRVSGRLLVPCGLVAALSGLWMTLFYALPAYDGGILHWLRLLFGSGMLLAILLGVAALGRRDFVQHGAWMLRGYAIGLGAGTQVLTHLPLLFFPDSQGQLTRALCMGAGWVINLVVAERIIRRRRSRLTRTPAVAPAVV